MDKQNDIKHMKNEFISSFTFEYSKRPRKLFLLNENRIYTLSLWMVFDF